MFQTSYDLVGAICDEELLDRELYDEKLGVKVRISRDFYGGVLIDARVAVKMMGKVSIGNIIGKEIVGLALRGGFITEENTILIDGVPHAQFIKV